MSQSGIQTSFMGKGAETARKWYKVDAKGQILGRLAVRIARVLMGKHKPEYTPHADTGDFVVVENANKIAVTGDKMDTKIYQTFSGYPDGQKRKPLRGVLASKNPEDALRLAVRRMLPKSRLGRKMILKLKLHTSLPKHGYTAQQLAPFPADAKSAKAAAKAK